MLAATELHEVEAPQLCEARADKVSERGEAPQELDLSKSSQAPLPRSVPADGGVELGLPPVEDIKAFEAASTR